MPAQHWGKVAARGVYGFAAPTTLVVGIAGLSCVYAAFATALDFDEGHGT